MTPASATAAPDPPEAVRLLAHPIRWRVLQELARSDRTVRELTELVDEPQSLVSYHVRQLRDHALVARRRSSADGRDTYYSVDLRRCQAELRSSTEALHPGLWPTAPARPTSPTNARILFLCTGNSGRSQIAEALTNERAGAAVAVSAGSHPKPLHPNAVTVMRRRGIDISGSRTKHLDEFAAQPFDMVITLCDRVREVCPELPLAAERVHWSMADPSAEGSTLAASYPAFERAASEIEARVGFLLDALTRSSEHGRSSDG